MPGAVADVLMYGDTIRSPELRHEVPISIPDPFLYAEHDGRRVVVIHSLEVPRVRALDGVEVLAWEELGLDELIAEGVEREKLYLHIALRGCERLGIEGASVPRFFPLELADWLRAHGVEVRADQPAFAERRRVKRAAEIGGIRRAQRAAEAAMDAVRDMLRRSRPANGVLELDGEPLTSERIKRTIGEVLSERDMLGEEFVVSHGPQSAIGHEMGFGPIVPHEPIVVDLWPRDRETGCYADMTRTFVVGEASDELREFHRLVLQALQQTIAAIEPGVGARDLFVRTCELFQRHGYKTQLSKEPGEVLEDGFFHGLGHGVGLDVHEDPSMGLTSRDRLVSGDVVTVEPGLYRSGYGGCRLEDVVLVTESGAENLTDYPYDLQP